MLNSLKALILGSLLIFIIGCSVKENENDDLQYTHTDYDSLYRLGDSVLKDYYEIQAANEHYHDSLHGSLSLYETKLQEKHIREERDRIKYKDTVIVRIQFKEVVKMDTIFKKVVVTDTIRDTVKISYFQQKKNK